MTAPNPNKKRTVKDILKDAGFDDLVNPVNHDELDQCLRKLQTCLADQDEQVQPLPSIQLLLIRELEDRT